MNFMWISLGVIVLTILAISLLRFRDTSDSQESAIKREQKDNVRTDGSPRVELLEWVDITFPDEEGIWKIKIIPVEYEEKLVYTEGQGFADKVVYKPIRRQRAPEDNADNIIAADTLLAQAILGKKEGETYYYKDHNNQVVVGKIIKIYKEKD